LILLLSFVPAVAHAQQASSGIIASNRAVDWTQAGVPGGIPNRTHICTTIAPYGSSASPASAAPITAAIGACSSAGGGVVLLGAGTFYLSDDIAFSSFPNYYSNVTLRGQGANATFIVSSSGFVGCSGGWTNIDMCGSQNYAGPGGPQNVCDFTGTNGVTGTYTQGATTITLNNCGTTIPASGGGPTLGKVIILDQLDETSDTGTIWNCTVDAVCAYANQGGGARVNGPCGSWQGTWNSATSYTVGQGVKYTDGNSYIATANNTNSAPAYQATTPWYTCFRSQQQTVKITSISGSGSGPFTIGLSTPLYMPNWRTSQLPQAWFAATQLSGDGIEDFSIDATNSTSSTTIQMNGCIGCWLEGIRSIDAGRSHVAMGLGMYDEVRDSYFYLNRSSGSVSYGVELGDQANSKVENNIFQQVTDSTPSCTAACEANVLAYNFDINNQYWSPGWFQAGFYQHSAGDVFNLWEGNIGLGYNADPVHGTHHFETLFRNYLIGQQAAGCAGSPCVAQTIPIQLYSGSRYFNIIGNVLGQAGYHNHYTCNAISTAPCTGYGSSSIYVLGYTGNGGQTSGSPAYAGYCSSPSCPSIVNYDPQVYTYLMRWGNYDTVNAAVQWNSLEVPSTIGSYSNAVPSGHALPTSFYLSGKPTWFGSVPFPPIGPDVSGGNISGVGGYANEIPAMVCFLNTMGGSATGAGGVLSFNAGACYGYGSQPGAQGPIAPTGVNAAVQQ
jgi:hypothetical protein